MISDITNELYDIISHQLYRSKKGINWRLYINRKNNIIIISSEVCYDQITLNMRDDCIEIYYRSDIPFPKNGERHDIKKTIINYTNPQMFDKIISLIGGLI